MQITINNHPIHYEIFGEGQPLILLPGWSMSAHDLAHSIEPAFDGRAGWQRIYINPPGHGATPGAHWIQNLDDMLDLLLEAVDNLTAGAQFALYGLSLGAYLARGILYHRSEKLNGLCLVVPAIKAEDAERNVPIHTVLIEEPGIMEQLQDEEIDYFAMCTVRTSHVLYEIRSFPQPPEGAAGDMDFLTSIREDPQKYRFSFAVDQLKRPFPAPTTIITGRQDSIVGYKDAWEILDNYPRATFVVTDRASHLMEEKNEFINFLIREWLDRVEEYAED